jgi:hypothetical protein
MIPELIDGELTFLCGPVASGKTYLAQKWYEMLPRVVVFDTSAEYDELPGEHFWQSPRKFAERIERSIDSDEGYHLIYHPGNDANAGFEWVIRALWQPLEPRVLICEEVHEFMNPSYEHDHMRIVSKYARKRNLGFVGISQRIADTHRNFTSACRRTILFYTQEARDLDAISDRWGQEAAASVSNLRPLVHRDGTHTTEQTPEALFIERGQPPIVIEVG